MCGKRISGLNESVGCECCISRREARWARCCALFFPLSYGSIPAGEVRGRSHTAGRCGVSKKNRTQQGGKLQN